MTTVSFLFSWTLGLSFFPLSLVFYLYKTRVIFFTGRSPPFVFHRGSLRMMYSYFASEECCHSPLEKWRMSHPRLGLPWGRAVPFPCTPPCRGGGGGAWPFSSPKAVAGGILGSQTSLARSRSIREFPPCTALVERVYLERIEGLFRLFHPREECSSDRTR